MPQETQIRGCATADGKLDSGDSGIENSEPGALRKTLSCSAKGILTKGSSAPGTGLRDVSPTPGPMPSLHAALGHAASRTLLRESSGPLPYACMSVPTAPVTVPLATLSPPVPYRGRPASPPVPAMNAARRVFYPRVQPPANWVHQVKALKFAQHPHPPPPQQAVCSRRTVVWQPGLGGPTLLQSKPVAGRSFWQQAFPQQLCGAMASWPPLCRMSGSGNRCLPCLPRLPIYHHLHSSGNIPEFVTTRTDTHTRTRTHTHTHTHGLTLMNYIPT